jgi:hypothetical protein
MATSTVQLQYSLETIKNLNDSTQSMSSTVNIPGASDGLYAMINAMISDLSSIKASVKTEEKNILTDINAHVKNLASESTTTTPQSEMSAPSLTAVASTHNLNTGLGSGTSRHETDPGTGANQQPAVLKTNSKAYSEDAVFGVLAVAAEIITTLKNGDFATNVTAGVTATTLQAHS